MFEEAMNFACCGDPLVGVLSLPADTPEAAVIVVVGGPQTRVGSHRQFVLLARALAASGIACLRFDYRGMGDAQGDPRTFEEVDADIAAARMALDCRLPGLKRRYLWGLCDGATAAVFHAASWPGFDGVVLLNPWVRTQEGESAALVADYYRGRFLSLAFWRKALSGKMDLLGRMREFLLHWRASRSVPTASGEAKPDTLPVRLASALSGSRCRVLLILSGRDLTASEFKEASLRSPLREALDGARLKKCELAEANHTFSSAAWRSEVERLTVEWIQADSAMSRVAE